MLVCRMCHPGMCFCWLAAYGKPTLAYPHGLHNVAAPQAVVLQVAACPRNGFFLHSLASFMYCTMMCIIFLECLFFLRWLVFFTMEIKNSRQKYQYFFDKKSLKGKIIKKLFNEKHFLYYIILKTYAIQREGCK